jgi:hypothetical protein
MKVLTIGIITVLVSICCFNAYSQYYPKLTEVWEPIPEIISPFINNEALPMQ